MRKKEMIQRLTVENKATELLMGLGLKSSTKCFHLIRQIICDLCYEDLLSKKESIYEYYARETGLSVASVERFVSYGNDCIFQRKTPVYSMVFGWYGDEGAKIKRNYEFLKGLKDYLRRSFFKEWDVWNQRDILINDCMLMMGVTPTSRGFHLLKEGIHCVMEAYGDLLPMKDFFKEGNLPTNLAACSRALVGVEAAPKQFIYDLSRDLLIRYPELVN